MKRKLIVIVLILMLMPSLGYCDIGPKPQLDIRVLGLEDYYLDLLIESDHRRSNKLDKLTEEEKLELKKLIDYQEGDLKPALLQGSKIPIFGEIEGLRLGEEEYIHNFSYLGLPDEFKIIVLRGEQLIISPMVKRRHFESEMTWDLRDTDLREDINLDIGEPKEIFPWEKFSREFIVRIIMTILIELLIAILFSFSLKESGKLIIATNLATQTLLNLGVYTINLYYGMMAAMAIFIVLEIFILVFESWIYYKSLTEHNPKRRIIYGIVANLGSFIGGIILTSSFIG